MLYCFDLSDNWCLSISILAPLTHVRQEKITTDAAFLASSAWTRGIQITEATGRDAKGCSTIEPVPVQHCCANCVRPCIEMVPDCVPCICMTSCGCELAYTIPIGHHFVECSAHTLPRMGNAVPWHYGSLLSLSFCICCQLGPLS